MASQIRQNYHEDCEASINKQINMELYASYVYMSMVSVLSLCLLPACMEGKLGCLILHSGVLGGFKNTYWWRIESPYDVGEGYGMGVEGNVYDDAEHGW